MGWFDGSGAHTATVYERQVRPYQTAELDANHSSDWFSGNSSLTEFLEYGMNMNAPNKRLHLKNKHDYHSRSRLPLLNSKSRDNLQSDTSLSSPPTSDTSPQIVLLAFDNREPAFPCET
jgi:hypothetical protein